MEPPNWRRWILSEVLTKPSLDEAITATARAVNDYLETALPRPNGPEGRLFEAMRYAMLGGGKRLRPFLVIQTAGLFGVDAHRALRAGAAVELIHSYSLIHDDLPAMDDDDLRRGQPSCHVAFDEATAILAGDALLTLAFEVLADPDTHADAAVRCDLVGGLARAAGASGMVGGQMIDLASENITADAALVSRLERMKTGALIAFSCEASAILAGAPLAHRRALQAFGLDIGLAFQIADDLLDVEGDEVALGKTVGKDAAAGKATFVSTLGAGAARREACELIDRAAARLRPFGPAADSLTAFCEYVLNRRS
jgi:farnesyl diphosphate synthase